MIRIKKAVNGYWLWFSLGCVLTKLVTDYTYIERGYRAFGSEWLILPMVLLTAKTIKEIMRNGEECEKRIAKNCRNV